ncbi:right-handed parallel beta-helix repeat-containing protein [bacterium]|nr:right-handed parallel beta-helix repeat-containing protein [candidate division CSSED10-310 bacterium]
MRMQFIAGICICVCMCFCIQSNAAPDCTATGDLSDVCAGTTGLTASVPAGPVGTTYFWTISANGTITGPNDQPSVTYSANSAGLLTLTILVTDPMSDTCEEGYSFTVFSNPTPDIMANGVATSLAHACNGVNLNLNGNPSGGSGSWTQHQWSGSGYIYLISGQTTQTPVFMCTTPGSYSLTYRVTDTHSCQGEDTITIQVHNNPICAILVEGISQETATVCSGIGLALDGNPSGGSGSFPDHAWTGNGAQYLSDDDIQNPIFTGVTAGTFTLNYMATDSYGCTTTDTLTVTVQESPIANILSGGTSTSSEWLCLGESTVLDGHPSGGSGGYTHEWTGDDLDPLGGATNIQAPTFVTSTPGTYVLHYTVTASDGCWDTDTISVRVENPSAEILVNGISTSDFEICQNVSVTLNGNPTGGSGGNIHLWSGDWTLLNNRNIQSPTFNTSTPGSYYLEYLVTDSEGCSAGDSISITVHPNPMTDILIAGNPLSSDWLCIGESVQLDGNPSGGSGIFPSNGHYWSGSGWLHLNDQYSQTPIFTGNTAGTFSLTYRVTDSRGCIRTDSITIRVADPIPDIEADGSPAAAYTACSGQGIILNGNPKNGSHVYVSHSWTGATDPLDRTDIQSPIFNATSTGSYLLYYTVIDTEGCVGTDSIVITVINNPVANAGPDNLVLHGESVVLDASSSSCSGGCEYLWEVVSGDMASIDEGYNTVTCTVSPESATIYQVTVTDGAGCTDSDTVVITVGAIPIPTLTYNGLLLLLLLVGFIMYRVCRNRIRIRNHIAAIIFLIGLNLAGTGFAQTAHFVNPASTSPGSPFTSWQTAGHTIQAVINACNNGDILYVANGTYTENILLDKDITLLSWCMFPENCIIQAPDMFTPALTISDPDLNNHQIVVAGFRFQGGSNAVYLANNSSSVQIPLIRNCVVDDYDTGILCQDGVFSVEFCTIANNSVGIFANNTSSRSAAYYNIISDNSTYGIRVDASYFQMRDNCYYNNGVHLFGPPDAYCDEWSLDVLPSGVDPVFIPGTFQLDPASPCRDFHQADPYTACNENRFDQNESPFDLGAYGGYGSYPLPPVIEEAYLDPEPGDFKIAANAPISFRILDQGTAGLDLDTLIVRIENHGHPAETYTRTALNITPYPQYGSPPDDCLAMGYDMTLPGTTHALFSDFANVRTTVSISDRCPQPNHYSYHWEFYSDDLNPPVLMPGYYPGPGAVNVPIYGPIEMDLYDAGIGIDPESIFLTLNGDPLSLNLSEISWTGNHLTIIPRPRFVAGTSNTLTFTISDFYGNPLPAAIITFMCAEDTDLPFVPGVTGPSASPGLPAIAPDPIPAPASNDADVVDPITFSFQDFSSIVDLMNLHVSIHSGSSTYHYYFESHGGSSRVFQVSGDPQARRISCNPVGGWALNAPITVTITDGTDTAVIPNTMITAVYSFTCSTAPLPSTTVWGLALLLAIFSIILICRKR